MDDRVSVGVVGEKAYLYRDNRDPAEIFAREVGCNAWIRDHLARGRRVEPHLVTSDFSYRSRYCAEDGLVLIGDAFAFLDPVFSSGVLLALKSGELAGDAVHAALAAGDVSASRFRDYGERMCTGIEAMRRLVYTFYDDGFSFREVLQAHPELQADLTDCLIGHLDRDYDTLFDAVREFARLPEPLAHGRPLEAVPAE
jgi:flavin-dependent dehydrogenase